MPRQGRAVTKTQRQKQPRAHTKPTQSPLGDAEVVFVEARHSVEAINAHEEQRRLRAEGLVSKNELENVQQDLARERQELQLSQRALQDCHYRIHTLMQNETDQEVELNCRIKECERLRAQLEASQQSTTDASKHLTENFALTRELTNMKPELEHLRTQAETHSNLLSEKLLLQAQLKNIQAELLENKRMQKHLQKMEQKNGERTHAAEQCMEKLAEELGEARAAQAKAEQERDEAIAASAAQKMDTKKSNELQAVREEVVRERKERKQEEKAHDKESQAWGAEKAVLHDKLNQFRTKLRSTKERLREAEAELQTARAGNTVMIPQNKQSNSRKRKASQSIEADAVIGTPGDGDAHKRQKRASSVVGEKSTFSVTPFLNRTSSVQPDEADEPVASIEDQSPVSRPATKVLAPAGAGKSNPKVKPRRPARKRSAAAPTTLEQVDEEEDSNDENTVPISLKPANGKSPNAKSTKPMLKPRKSLANFSSFREGSLQPRSRLGSVEPVTKKKRKLTGSAVGKTLMDDDDEEESGSGAPNNLGGRSLFGGGGVQRAFGSFGKTAGGFGGAMFNKRQGPLQTADGFAFSPLKKDRRAMAAANRAASEASEA
ncbi:MAG: hypothetical protein Q9159_007147 [Coniocarpon cinnabarinum]